MVDLNDYSVCELTLLQFNDYTNLIEAQVASEVSPMYMLTRIGSEIDFKLNEFIKNQLVGKTRSL